MSESNPVKPRPRRSERTREAEPRPRMPVQPANTAVRVSERATVIGWQGIRFRLPPDWNLTGFSMNREDGYLRVDAPGDEMLTVQVRWLNTSRPETTATPTLYTLASAYLSQKFRRAPLLSGGGAGKSGGKPDLRANLDRILRDTEKATKKSNQKAKSKFESTVRAERIEGTNGERTVLPFSWVGEGRGQGKIWHCATCGRIVVAQVTGLARAHAAIANIATHLFGSFHDHATGGYDLWALYDLEIELPEEFRLLNQKLLSGHLHLEWGRSGERVVLDRWGLANMTLKKFKPAEWFSLHAHVALKRMQHATDRELNGHALDTYTGSLPLMARARIMRDANGGLQRLATRYEGGIWNCPYSNKLIALQVLHQRKTVGLWQEIAERYHCHTAMDKIDIDKISMSNSDIDGINVDVVDIDGINVDGVNICGVNTEEGGE